MTLWRCLVATEGDAGAWRTVEAASEAAALAHLAGKDATVLEIRPVGTSGLSRFSRVFSLQSHLGVADQSLLLSQLATLVQSGLPIDRSLDLLREQASRSAPRTAIATMLTSVRGGGSLSKAFEDSRTFPTYVVGVVRSAERGGGLGAALSMLAGRLTIVADTRRQLVTALTYPAAILVASLLAVIVVLTLVIPQFQPIFSGQEARLPLLTQMVLAFSNSVMAHPLIIMSALPLSVLTLAAAFRSDIGRAFIRTYGHRLPVLGLRDQYLAAQFSGILGTLLANGVKIVEALPLVRDAMASDRWKIHADHVTQRIREGASLSSALARDSLLPPTAIRLIEVGEKSGTLAQTCQQASAIIGDAVRARVERGVALANPIAIIALGGLVAGLVGGVMLGIFALGDFAG